MRSNHNWKLLVSYVLAGFCLLVTSRGFAGQSGVNAGDFLNLEVGATAAGMGGAYTAFADGAVSMFWNPAGLSVTQQREVFLESRQASVGPTVFSLATKMRRKQLHLGFSVRTLEYGSLSRTTYSSGNSGVAIGSFSPGAKTFGIGVSQQIFSRLSLGFVFRYLTEEIDGFQASTTTVDIGSLLRINDHWKLGVVGKNLVGTLRYISVANPLPRTVRLGLGWTSDRRVLSFSVDAQYIRMGASMLRTGLNYRFRDSTKFRIGYRFKQDSGSGLGFGLGLNPSGKVMFDYAYVPSGIMGDNHLISVKWKFR